MVIGNFQPYQDWQISMILLLVQIVVDLSTLRSSVVTHFTATRVTHAPDIFRYLPTVHSLSEMVLFATVILKPISETGINHSITKSLYIYV